MNIAFDCQGTLIGHKQETIRKVLRALLERGHSVTIWSSMISYALEVKEEMGLATIDIAQKYSIRDAEEYEKTIFDVAIDDDSLQARYLAAKTFLNVSDISDDLEATIKELERLSSLQ